MKHKHYFKIILIILISTLSYSCKNNSLKEKELNLKEREINLKEKQITQKKKHLNDILSEDLKSIKIIEIPKLWSERYNELPEKFKHNVIIGLDSYEVKNVESLIRGFGWGCKDHKKINDLGELIALEIGYNNPEISYKSGMVYQYYVNQVLKCE